MIMKRIFLLFFLICAGCVSLSAQESGFKASLRGSWSVGSPVSESYSSLDIVLGYQIENSLYIGAGTGWNNSFAEVFWIASGDYGHGHGHGHETDYLLPVFARVKYNITRSRISPFAAVDAGYLFAMTGQLLKGQQGFFATPAIGVDFFVGRGLRHYFSVQIGLLIQEKDWFDNGFRYEISNRKTVRPDLRVAFTF
jgi:hypothetical protein